MRYNGSMRKFFCLFSLVSFLVGGCTKQERPAIADEPGGHKKIIVGFSQIGAESAWRVYNSKSVQVAAAREGVRLLFSDAEQKQENQIKAIRSFIVYQVDVIAFVPIVQDGWDNVLREAKEAGIPVLVCDREIVTEDKSLYAGYIGTDSTEEGRNAARFLQRKYRDAEDAVSILELRGTDGSSASDRRAQGFREIIGEDSRFSIIYSESGDFMRSRGREIAKSLLDENDGQLAIDGRKVDVIFSANDGMTLGFLEMLESHSIVTGKDVCVVTVDAQQEAIDRLKGGTINCVVECNPDLGVDIIRLAKKLVAHEEIPRLSYVGGRVFTEYDDLSLIEARGY